MTHLTRSLPHNLISLMYITPSFCEQVLETVSSQINNSYEKFLEVHPSFLANDGKCHLAGHSLGSVIVWDLLAILKEFQEPVPKQQLIENGGGRMRNTSSGGVQIVSDDNNTNIGYQAYAEENAGVAQNGSWGPTLPKRFQGPPLPFIPEDVIFLGSPIGMFLTLRGSHPVFDELRRTKVDEVTREYEEKIAASEGESPKKKATQVGDNSQELLPELPYAAPFTLPLEGGLYNIFSQSDPVAYRIEPLLLPPDMNINDIPAPVHLTVQGQGVRLHVKAQQIGDEIAKAMEGKAASITNLFAQAATALGKSLEGESSSTRQLKLAHSSGPAVFLLGGKSQRVDYQLQKGVVDNEYLSAITAHSTYFVNTDFLDFVANIGAKVPKKEEIVAVPESLVQQEVTQAILEH